jgi:PAS domain S-box-containing protein
VLSILLVALSIAFLVLLFDVVSTRKKLRDKEIRLQTVIESQPECVKLQTREGMVLEMNQAGLNLLQAQSAGDVIGKSVFDFIGEEHHADYRKLTENVFNGQRQIMEFKIRGARGAERWLETNAVPLKDQNQNIVALLALTRDVTERKKLEIKLQQRQMELDHVCRISTMGEVASGIAHELNQPLCAISSYAETSVTHLKANDGVKLEETLHRISEQARRASRIVTWIRELAGKKETNFAELHLDELLQDVRLMVRYYLEEHKTRLVIEIEDGLPACYGDRIQIEQVVINLIKNAVEAMSQHLRKGVIRVKAARGNTGQVTLFVSDNGTGIPQDNKTQVLNPYFTTKKGSLGMGLSICRSVISAHQGKIWIEKTDEFGTVIAISLNTCSADIPKQQYA